MQKRAYICGALTELRPDHRDHVKAFYSLMGDICGEILDIRAFVPHEHYDPIKAAALDKTVVYNAEHEIVTKKTSLIIVYAIEPSWGGGVEIGWANENAVPIINLIPKEKERISRLLTGGHMVIANLFIASEEDAIKQLKTALIEFKEKHLKLPAIPSLIP